MQFLPCNQTRPRQRQFLVASLLFSASVFLPPPPVLAANSCWFGAPARSPSALPSCNDPAFSFELLNRFYLHILKLPTQGAGEINFTLLNPEENPEGIVGVDVSFIPPLEIQGSSPPLSGEFNYQISISPFDTDYFASASLLITPPPAEPPSDPAAITLVQQIPEANLSLNASDASPVSLTGEPDPLKSITLLGQYTLNSGRLESIQNGFGIFFIDPPEPVHTPAPLPLCGAAMAYSYSRHLRRRIRLSGHRRGGITPAG